jgi:hypothetical protein
MAIAAAFPSSNRAVKTLHGLRAGDLNHERVFPMTGNAGALGL